MKFTFSTCIKNEGSPQFVRLEQTVLEKSADYKRFVIPHLFILLYISREQIKVLTLIYSVDVLFSHSVQTD
jgi:hypothetical protein